MKCVSLDCEVVRTRAVDLVDPAYLGQMGRQCYPIGICECIKDEWRCSEQRIIPGARIALGHLEGYHYHDAVRAIAASAGVEAVVGSPATTAATAVVATAAA